jgi:formate--tetrahydrofolate ligase
MKSDIEISENTKKIKIATIAKRYGIDNKYLFNYGPYMAKVDLSIMSKLPKKQGKLILVTSINPTPYGEGKTTMAIGLCDALNSLGKSSIVALREPSMGPVFGIKGGATGGGYSQVMPMNSINLNFTGDMHALTSANNLLCAIIDNHIYQGNALKIKNVLIPRCLDINDRALRNIEITTKKCEREDHFMITVATELMAILCLSTDFNDLKRRIAKMIVATDIYNKPIYVSDLKATDALAIILSDAINPNIVETLEHNLAIIHGGPFANIAHGTNSIIATNMALRLSDYTVTEAGFGADLGAEKFLDIASIYGKFKTDAIIINVTVRSLKHHGGVVQEDLNKLNVDGLRKGLTNLDVHLENMRKYTQNVVVCINKFQNDYPEEINTIIKYCESKKVLSSISTTYSDGGKGGIDLAKKVIAITKEPSDVISLYDYNDSIKNKIAKIAKEIYRATDVVYSEQALKDIALINKLKLNNYPICIAKTQYSISDNPKLLGFPHDYEIHIESLKVNNGAEFIVALTSNVLTMPGLGANSAYLNMTIDNNKHMKGLF